MTSNIYFAKVLRDKNALKEIPSNHPGYYKWWATEDDVIAILDKLGVSHTEAVDNMEKKEILGEVRYCIYIGIAVSESVRSRLDWHINQQNTERNVKNGFLSTLRKTLSALFGKNMLDNEATNNFIDRLAVEYFLSENEIKSPEARDELHRTERAHLEKNLYVLNIQENKHPLAPLKKLKAIRKNAKII